MHTMLSSIIDYEICQESQDPNDIGCGLNLPDFVVIDLDPYVHASTQKQEIREEPQYNSNQAFKASVEVALELKEMMDGSICDPMLKLQERRAFIFYSNYKIEQQYRTYYL
jgi:hypothetical protein